MSVFEWKVRGLPEGVEAQQVLNVAHAVVRIARHGKRHHHGGDVYEDQHIKVWMNSDLLVWVKRDGEEIEVFSMMPVDDRLSDCFGLGAYRPGNWEGYLAGLATEAVALDIAEEDAQDEWDDTRWQPVDDAALAGITPVFVEQAESDIESVRGDIRDLYRQLLLITREIGKLSTD